VRPEGLGKLKKISNFIGTRTRYLPACRYDEGMDWIYLAQDRDQWRALVKMIAKRWVP
jgi:hypothetical protein